MYDAQTLESARALYAEVVAEGKSWSADEGLIYDSDDTDRDLRSRLARIPEGTPEYVVAKAALDLHSVITWAPHDEHALERMEWGTTSLEVGEDHRQWCREQLPQRREKFERLKAKYEALTGKPYVSVTVKERAVRELVERDAEVIAARAEWERQQEADDYPPVPHAELREALRDITERNYRTQQAAQQAYSRAVYAFENDYMDDLNPRQRNLYREGLKEQARYRAQAHVQSVEAASRRRAEQELEDT
ncbi:hypothetical protein [Mycobacteroides franklinii]|uniref:hypothetical protein n=1 Tax=Mycobacteroides franklinii TaxID=948102 RepID=UPI00099436D4|nr:hypothetical protein [Mycobacteroides franklinii]